MQTIIFILHVFSCLFLIGLILIQRGQGANMGAAFGGASQTVFGSRGPATFLNKLTIIIAVIFLSASIYLAHFAKHQTTSTVVDEAQKLKTDETKAETVIEEETSPVEDVLKKEPVKAEEAAEEINE